MSESVSVSVCVCACKEEAFIIGNVFGEHCSNIGLPMYVHSVLNIQIHEESVANIS